MAIYRKEKRQPNTENTKPIVIQRNAKAMAKMKRYKHIQVAFLMNPIFKSSNSKIEYFLPVHPQNRPHHSTWLECNSTCTSVHAHKMLRANKFKWCNRTEIYNMYISTWLDCVCACVCMCAIYSQRNRQNRFDCLYLHQLILSTLEMDYISVQSIMRIYCHLHTIQNEWQRNERIEIKVIRLIIASIIFPLLLV